MTVGKSTECVQAEINCTITPHFDIIGNMRSKYRLIIDTNILVAATRNRLGPSYALLQLVRQRLVAICCSPALFLEYEDVLKRPLQLAASGLLPSDVDAILNELAGLVVLNPEQAFARFQLRPIRNKP